MGLGLGLRRVVGFGFPGGWFSGKVLGIVRWGCGCGLFGNE